MAENSAGKSGVLSPQMQKKLGPTKIKVGELNSHFTCHICAGYLVDASTLTVCKDPHHAFCRSCLLKYFGDEEKKNSKCPECGESVNINQFQSQIKPDHTLQDLAFKLVPGLYRKELKRRRDFYSEICGPSSADSSTSKQDKGKFSEEDKAKLRGKVQIFDKHLVELAAFICTPEEILSLSVEYAPTSSISADKKTEEKEKDEKSEKKENSEFKTPPEPSKKLKKGKKTPSADKKEKTAKAEPKMEVDTPETTSAEKEDIKTEPDSGNSGKKLEDKPEDSEAKTGNKSEKKTKKSKSKKNDTKERSFENLSFKRYFRCPGAVSIGHLKKLLQFKLELPANYQIEMSYAGETLSSDLTLVDVAYIYCWRRKAPMSFSFNICKFEIDESMDTMPQLTREASPPPKLQPPPPPPLISQESTDENNKEQSASSVEISKGTVTPEAALIQESIQSLGKPAKFPIPIQKPSKPLSNFVIESVLKDKKPSKPPPSSTSEKKVAEKRKISTSTTPTEKNSEPETKKKESPSKKSKPTVEKKKSGEKPKSQQPKDTVPSSGNTVVSTPLPAPEISSTPSTKPSFSVPSKNPTPFCLAPQPSEGDKKGEYMAEKASCFENSQIKALLSAPPTKPRPLYSGIFASMGMSDTSVKKDLPNPIKPVTTSPAITTNTTAVKALPESSQTVQKMPESSQTTQKMPESSQTTQKMPESSETAQRLPESSQTAQKLPESGINLSSPSASSSATPSPGEVPVRKKRKPSSPLKKPKKPLQDTPPASSTMPATTAGLATALTSTTPLSSTRSSVTVTSSPILAKPPMPSFLSEGIPTSSSKPFKSTNPSIPSFIINSKFPKIESTSKPSVPVTTSSSIFPPPPLSFLPVNQPSKTQSPSHSKSEFSGGFSPKNLVQFTDSPNGSGSPLSNVEVEVSGRGVHINPPTTSSFGQTVALPPTTGSASLAATTATTASSTSSSSTSTPAEKSGSENLSSTDSSKSSSTSRAQTPNRTTPAAVRTCGLSASLPPPLQPANQKPVRLTLPQGAASAPPSLRPSFLPHPPPPIINGNLAILTSGANQRPGNPSTTTGSTNGGPTRTLGVLVFGEPPVQMINGQRLCL